MRQAYVIRGNIKPKLLEGGGIKSSILSGIKKAMNIGKTVDNAVFGEVGTKISNAIPNTDAKARPLFSGERHAVLKIGDTYGRANWMGPATRVIERLERGDLGRTPVDDVSKRHDIDYFFAENIDDVRTADKRMLASVARLEKSGGDSKFNLNQGKLIAAKVALENMGVNPERFTSFGGVNDSNRAILEKSRNELEQMGYGKPVKSSKKLPPGLKLKRKLLAQHCGQSGQGIYEDVTAEIDNLLPKNLKGKLDAATLNLIKKMGKKVLFNR